MSSYELTPQGIRRAKAPAGGKAKPPSQRVPEKVTVDVGPACVGGRHIYTVEYGKGKFHFCPRYRLSLLEGHVDTVIAPGIVLGPRAWGVPKVLTLEWADHGVPEAAPRCFWDALLDEVAGGQVLAFCCMGGHGRTGTALAVVLALVEGLSADQAVERVRTAYCPAAVESLSQEAYVREVLEGVVCTTAPARYVSRFTHLWSDDILERGWQE